MIGQCAKFTVKCTNNRRELFSIDRSSLFITLSISQERGLAVRESRAGIKSGGQIECGVGEATSCVYSAADMVRASVRFVSAM